MAELGIGEVARRAGIRTSTLRYYEDAGVLPPARRVNGRRRYSEELVDLLQVARFAQSVGFSLAEIRSLLRSADGPRRLRARWMPVARAKLKEIDAAIARARRMKRAIEIGLECGCIRIEDCLPPARRSARGKPRRPV